MESIRKLKIGFVLDDTLDKPDGVQQYVLAVGKWLSEHGHTVHYIVGRSVRKDILNVHSMSKNVPVKFNGNHLSIPLPASRKAIIDLLRSEDFDVLHVQTPHSPFMAQRVISLVPGSTAIVSTFHILPHTKLAGHANKILGKWLRSSLNRIDSFLAVSDAAAQFAHKSYGITCKTIPNTIDLQPFFAAKSYKQYENIPTIVYLNRLEPRKGCIFLLQAVNYLINVSKYPDPFRVIICGKGSQKSILQKYVMENNLQDIVKFEGFVSEADKPRFLASADIVCYPSMSGESFGIVLLEGMAASKGVVLAGNNPGYASVMRPFPEQLLDCKNTNTFATLLVRALRDAKMRTDVSIKQKKYAIEFDINVVGPQILAVYQSVLHTKR